MIKVDIKIKNNKYLKMQRILTSIIAYQAKRELA
jgi:hypothetical protein